MVETILFTVIIPMLLGAASLAWYYHSMYIELRDKNVEMRVMERARQAATRRIKVIASSSYEPEELSKAELADIRWNLIKQLTRKINKKSCMEYKAGVYMMEFDVTQIKDESRKSI